MSKTGKRHVFQKGNKFGGRKPLPADLREAINQGKEQLYRDVLSIRSMTMDSAKAYKKDKEARGMLSLGETYILQAYVKLDNQAIKTIEDRVFGKAIETHSLTNSEGGDLFDTFLTNLKEQ